MKKIICAILIATTFAGCISNQSTQCKSVQTHTLHAEDVAQLSADDVLAMLKSGNKNFTDKKPTPRDAMTQLSEAAKDGQAPMAIVLSCIDSRVPVEMIFDMGLGDIFVARVAGNIVNNDMLGSMEYACEHSASKVVVILGHTSCGAVHAACEGVEAGNITTMLSLIKPAIEMAEKEGGDHHSSEFQDRVTLHNVRNMVAGIRRGSHILSHLEQEGKIKIVGAIFNLQTGVIDFLED